MGCHLAIEELVGGSSSVIIPFHLAFIIGSAVPDTETGAIFVPLNTVCRAG